MGIMCGKKYRTVLIGTGRIGFLLGFDKKREQPASHTMALLKNRRIDLLAGCDRDGERLKLWKNYVSKKGAEALCFKDSRELFKAVENIDIAVVAVNEEAHLEECVRAIEARPRLVILEKPVALNSAQAQLICRCAEENSVPVLVNHERRFDLNYALAKKWCKKIGEIQRVEGELDSGLRIYGKEFEKDGTYSLLHDGTHLVDIVRFLTGEELENPVVTGVFKDEKMVVRNFCASYKTEKIPEICLKMSGRSRFFEFRVEILGTEGKICIGNGIADFFVRKESRLYSGFYSLEKQRVRLPKKSGYFSGMVENAVDFLDGKAPVLSSLEEAVKDLKVLEEIKAFF
ncbi:Gfo/Idh/MocA family protein [Treponema berlinense]|uniref:Gfo/Idh/MocA family protein n=1 Tax=Treponema berlinense TaxID=225004 RepID=UPI0026EC26C8|nr:Gfo/Idh/MocA family oxidoreductase [Treponema berlinense]